jgi:hypothetical protein
MEQNTEQDRNVKAEKAAEVSRRVQMLEVRLLESRAEQKRGDEDMGHRITLNAHVETHVDGQRLEVFPHFRLVAKRPDASPDDAFIRIEARFVIVYSLTSLDNLNADSFNAFGEGNGIYNVWPYWREFVQSTTVRMGLPPLTLPVYRVGVTRLDQQGLITHTRTSKKLTDTEELKQKGEETESL